MIGFGNRASFVGCSVYSPHVSVSPEFVLISRYGRDFFFCDTWFDSGDPEWGTQNKKKKIKNKSLFFLEPITLVEEGGRHSVIHARRSRVVGPSLVGKSSHIQWMIQPIKDGLPHFPRSTPRRPTYTLCIFAFLLLLLFYYILNLICYFSFFTFIQIRFSLYLFFHISRPFPTLISLIFIYLFIF